MATRKVTVELKLVVQLEVEEGIEISQVVDEADYSFKSQTEGAEVRDTELRDYDITDSR